MWASEWGEKALSGHGDYLKTLGIEGGSSKFRANACFVANCRSGVRPNEIPSERAAVVSALAQDERRLSFQVVTIDTVKALMTVRECLWNAGSSLTWGGSVTVSLGVRP